MDMKTITDFITSVGFPIFVAVWMLYKTSKDSEQMKETINDLKNAINILTENIKKDKNENE